MSSKNENIVTMEISVPVWKWEFLESVVGCLESKEEKYGEFDTDRWPEVMLLAKLMEEVGEVGEAVQAVGLEAEAAVGERMRVYAECVDVAEQAMLLASKYKAEGQRILHQQMLEERKR